MSKLISECSTDELAQAFLASLAADVARVDELDRLHKAKYGRAAGQVPLLDAGRVVIRRICELTGNQHIDRSTVVGETFAEGRAKTEAAIARLGGE